MRVLIASTQGTGHLTPLLPFAEALRRRGDEVRFAVPPRPADDLRAAGWTVEVGDDPPADELDAIWRRVPQASPQEAAELVNRHVFGRLDTAAMLPTLERVCDAWPPDLVLRDPCEYASAIAAERRGIPQAQVAISLAAVEAGSLELARPELEAHLDGVAERILAAPYLTRFPASLDPSPWPRTVRFSEQASAPRARDADGSDGGAEPRPRRVGGEAASRRRGGGDGDADRPLVYATLGTVAGQLPLAVPAFRAVLDAVADLPARVLLTVGRDLDPSRLGTPPANVRVAAWVPQAEALAQADAVLCHGGSGTTFGALAAGLPLVLLPLFADQPVNGGLVARAGAGLVVDADPAAPDGDAAGRLREAVRAVLGDPAYRAAAQRVAAEMAEAATVDGALDRLAAA